MDSNKKHESFEHDGCVSSIRLSAEEVDSENKEPKKKTIVASKYKDYTYLPSDRITITDYVVTVVDSHDKEQMSFFSDLRKEIVTKPFPKYHLHVEDRKFDDTKGKWLIYLEYSVVSYKLEELTAYTS